ncbi:hypothetical protein BKA64DRAFT_368627 [Cadophora sp. MPI-SDFR-AT-0126]|nr:hypothetical protein BKA64DRAFT_368627 [Leotiomycetes sp. MPI-SDFR-AT-0126]
MQGKAFGVFVYFLHFLHFDFCFSCCIIRPFLFCFHESPNQASTHTRPDQTRPNHGAQNAPILPTTNASKQVSKHASMLERERTA